MLSKASKYAVRATLYLAIHSNGGHKIGVDEIAESLKVPKHFLAKVLQHLSKQKIISSVKGPGGGFYLSPLNRNISILEVINAFDPQIFTECVLGLPSCSHDKPCPLHIQAFAFRDGLKYQFENQNLSELAERIAKDGNLI